MKLSIITINLNNKSGLQKTIDSVINQNFSDFEYIVIDGGSNDGSVDVIRNNNKKITFWISEKDAGIYNAMNKGIKAASGEYCLFLNSGDYLESNQVLQEVFEYKFAEDIVYGDLMVTDLQDEIRKIEFPDKISFRHLYKSFLPHPSTFIKRRCFEIYGGYDESYSIVSDWAFMTKVIGKYNCSTRHIPLVIGHHMLGGISSDQKNLEKNSFERMDFLKKEFPAFYVDYESFDNFINGINVKKENIITRLLKAL